MADEAYDPFVQNIVGVLEKHGYPSKRVSLPLERMYEVAYEKGLNFNKALERLDALGIAHEKTKEKLVFFPHESAAAAGPAMPDFGELMARAQEMMKHMTPEQLEEVQRMVANLSDEERESLLRQAQKQ